MTFYNSLPDRFFNLFFFSYGGTNTKNNAFYVAKFLFLFLLDTFKSLSSDKFLLFAEGRKARIYKVPLAVPETPCSPLGIKTNISRPVAVDYDPIEGKVYWTDVTLKQIVRSYPNGSDLEIIAERNVEHPDGIAVDWIRRNVYWTDYQTNKIEVSRLDGSYRSSLITSGLDNPRALILDIDAR